MANGVFNYAKGVAVEKFNGNAAKFGVILLEVNQADGTLEDHATLAAILAAANTEATFGNYVRHTAQTATIEVDTTNDWVDLDIDNQTWTDATAGTALTKLVVYYEDAAADATRIPITHHDFVTTPDGSTITATIHVEGFYRAA